MTKQMKHGMEIPWLRGAWYLDGGTRLDTQGANILAGNFTQNFNQEETHSVLQIPDLDLTLSYKKESNSHFWYRYSP